ncbi:hypothetical protein HPB50_019933 [Hyalomma asiaticum]|uniref:Uncharacterized protein n=1 Tax=Hyalomma asiaticum TaxID=266040 RepID=A0ACB7SXZ5_HYAAI|nr:hypothetical protein HPB50_019933 [Hyalomma asiaticum]
MLERLVLCASMKDCNVTLLTALHMLACAWDQVMATTVNNCFRRSGFCATDESPGTECEPNQCEAEVIPAGLRDALDDSFEDYTDVDNSAVDCGTITNDEIIMQVTAWSK